MKINVAFDSLEEFEQYFGTTKQEPVAPESADIVKFPAQELVKEEPIPTPEPVKEEPAPEPEPVKEDPKPMSVSQEDLQQICVKLMDKGGQEKLIGLLRSFGAASVPALTEQQRAQFYVEVEKMLEA